MVIWLFGSYRDSSEMTFAGQHYKYIQSLRSCTVCSVEPWNLEDMWADFICFRSTSVQSVITNQVVIILTRDVP